MLNILAQTTTRDHRTHALGLTADVIDLPPALMLMLAAQWFLVPGKEATAIELADIAVQEYRAAHDHTKTTEASQWH